MEAPATQMLCRSCGLCCDGTLFGKVPLSAADSQLPLQAAGIEIQRAETETFFKLPCAAYQNKCCQVYRDRPASCRNYRCLLLKNYESGAVSWAEAQQKITRAVALIAALNGSVQRADPAMMRASLFDLSRLLPEAAEMSAQPELRKKYGPLMLQIAALSAYLQTHFQPKPEAPPQGISSPKHPS